jgi:hypothetical protein
MSIKKEDLAKAQPFKRIYLKDSLENSNLKSLKKNAKTI